MGQSQGRIVPMNSAVYVEELVDRNLAEIVRNVAATRVNPFPVKIENPNAEIVHIPGIGGHHRFHIGVTPYFFPWLIELVRQQGESVPTDISTEQLVWGKRCNGPTGPSPISWNIADQTKEYGCSFIVWCLSNGYSCDRNGRPLFAPVTTFISHAWKGTFSSLNDSVDRLSNIHNESGMLTIPAYFLDIFVVNQHTPPWRELPSVGMDVALRQPIELSHKTLLVMSPFEDPVPLKRAWCIYEICNTKRLGASLDITMPAEEHARFIAALTKGEFDFNDWVSNIDIEAAGAFDPADKEMIMALVQASPGAAAGLNRTVVRALCEWLGQQGKLALESLPEKEQGTSKLIKNLANVLWRQGNPEEAESLYRRMVTCRREAFGDSDVYTLDGLHVWGRFLRARGRHEEAKKVLEEAVAGRQDKLGPKHPDTLTSQMELAEVKRHLSTGKEDLADAEKVMSDVVRSWRELFSSMGSDGCSEVTDFKGYSDKDVREMRINFLESLKVYVAIMMRHRETPAKKVNAVIAELLRGRQILFGHRHPATLDVVVLQAQYNLSQNESIHNSAITGLRDALRILRGTLGDEHPRTLHCITILSQVLKQQVASDAAKQERIANGEEDESLTLITQAVRGYMQSPSFGPNHPDTRRALELKQRREGDISHYIDLYTSCFSPFALVLMADGVSTKFARDIQIGDRVFCPNGSGVTTIVGHTIQLEGKPRPLLLLDDSLLISKMHRIQWNGVWIRPECYPNAKEVYLSCELHNFVTDNCAPILVNGIVVSTIGTFCEGTHDLDKANHRLWASPLIVDVYKEHPNWPVIILQDNDTFLRAIKNKSFAADFLSSHMPSAVALLKKYGWNPNEHSPTSD